MKLLAKVALILLSIAAMIAGAQSATENKSSAQETQLRGYWVDRATELVWAGKNDGKDVSWGKAVKFCHDLRLAGYFDTRLANMAELQGIYDKTASAPGLADPPRTPRAFVWHVKGKIFLTGNEWSRTQILDDRGHPSGFAGRFDFN